MPTSHPDPIRRLCKRLALLGLAALPALASASTLPTPSLANIVTELNRQQAAYTSVRQALFGLNADGSANAGSLGSLSWNPSHDSSYWTVLDSSSNQPILPANWRYRGASASGGETLAVTGTHPGTQGRYAAFGGNPLGVPGNAVMDKLMLNTLAWLTRRSSPAELAGLRVVTAHLPGAETYWFSHETKVRSWLAERVPGVLLNGRRSADQADNLCDGAKLDACLQEADLLVIGREQGPKAYDGPAMMQAVTQAQQRGIPVLYLHHYRDTNDLADRLLAYFGLAQSNNYWSIHGLSGFEPASQPAVPPQRTELRALITRLERGSFSTTWSGCASSFGRVRCDGDTAYVNEFATPAGRLQEQLRALDSRSLMLFDQPGYALEKLLVQLGDKYRRSVSYPLRKEQDVQAFLRAYFSDKTVYLSRKGGIGLARNLGNYAAPIPVDTPLLNRSISLRLPVSGTRDHLSGLYVVPGRPVTLTRTDTSSAALRVGIHLLRDTTWLFNTYDRPTDISSPRLSLAPGQSLTLTSPYGGPLLLFVDAAADSAVQTARVQVRGVITHPVLRDATDPAQVAAFANALEATPTRWVGFATDTLTLHSTLDHFRQTMANYGNDLAALTRDTWIYTVKDTYELAGFNTASGKLKLAPAVAAFCTDKGWDCTGLQHRRDTMQHVVSDEHAACGSGCSGNPYDQDWPFEPLGWGESHEIGHNLQVGRLNIHGGQSGEVSNNIFPVHKQMMFNQTVAGQAAPIISRAGAGKTAFTALQAGLSSPDPVAAARSRIWGNTAYAANNTERVMFYRQLAEFARHYKRELNNGWELYTLMYLLHRNFDANRNNWPAVAERFGFGGYASYPDSISGNDFMLVASSFIIGRDMRPVFDLWGIPRSAAADAQVAAYGHPAAKPLFFPMSHISQEPSRVGAPIVMSPSAVYPLGY